MSWFEVKVPPTKLSFFSEYSLCFIHAGKPFIYNCARTAMVHTYFTVLLQQTNGL